MKVKVLCLATLLLFFVSGTTQAATYNDLNCDWCNLQHPYSLTVDAVSPIIYGRIYVEQITAAKKDPSLILAEVGYGSYLSNPLVDDAGWSWVSASYNLPYGNDYEYMGIISFPNPGTFSYTFRYSRDNGATWTLADIGGTHDGIQVDKFGVAVVNIGTGSPVPLPGALWLFGSGLFGIAGFKRRLTEFRGHTI